MTRDEALDLIQQYADTLPRRGGVLAHLKGMPERFPSDGSENKAMRWLGYMQGALVTLGRFSLDEVKEHSRTRRVEGRDHG